MLRKLCLLAAFSLGLAFIGAGTSTEAQARPHGWHKSHGYHHGYGPRRHHGWNRGHHYGWYKHHRRQARWHHSRW